MFYLILAEAFALGTALCACILAYPDVEATFRSRLSSLRIPQASEEDQTQNLTFQDRVLLPLWKRAGATVGGLTPDGLKGETQKRLQQGGNPLTLEGFMLSQVAGGVILGFVGFTIGGGNRLLLTIIACFLGLKLPSFWLSQQISKRRNQLAKSLPAAIDLLAIAVEAGLGFDGAMLQVAEKMPGPLADEVSIYLKEIRLGKPRHDALKALASRVDIPEMKTFTSAILQADTLGVSIAKVLFLQAEAIRLSRRQSAQEKAMKIPIKLLFPLVLFIFPSIFVVLLGPLVLHFGTLFGHH